MAHYGRRVMESLALAVLAFLAAAAIAEARPVLFARTPHVAQGKIVFSQHGDIWIAGAGRVTNSAAAAGRSRGTARAGRRARARWRG